MLNNEIIDGIIPEPLGGAHKDVDWMSNEIKQVITAQLQVLMATEITKMLNDRYEKFRKLGQFIDK